MPPDDEELLAIRAEWFDEVRRAAQTKCAWAHVGRVDIESPSLRDTMGGLIDRRVVRVRGDLREALEGWRRSPEGRIVDTVVARLNAAMVHRVVRSMRTVNEADNWIDDFGEGPIALLGRAADLVRAVRVSRDRPGAERLRPCAVNTQAETIVAITGAGAACHALLFLGIVHEQDGVAVALALDIQSFSTSTLRRIDLVPC